MCNMQPFKRDASELRRYAHLRVIVLTDDRFDDPEYMADARRVVPHGTEFMREIKPFRPLK